MNIFNRIKASSFGSHSPIVDARSFTREELVQLDKEDAAEDAHLSEDDVEDAPKDTSDIAVSDERDGASQIESPVESFSNSEEEIVEAAIAESSEADILIESISPEQEERDEAIQLKANELYIARIKVIQNKLLLKRLKSRRRHVRNVSSLITNGAIKRMQHRAGIPRLEGTAKHSIRCVYVSLLRNILEKAVIYKQHRRQVILTQEDVMRGCEHVGIKLYSDLLC